MPTITYCFTGTGNSYIALFRRLLSKWIIYSGQIKDAPAADYVAESASPTTLRYEMEYRNGSIAARCVSHA